MANVSLLQVFALGRDTKYCDQRVCMCVCLFPRISQKPHVQISLNFLYMLPMWPGLDPRLTAMRYVMYFRFCGRRHAFTW